MNHPTNKRGRPPGSGLKDEPYLRQVAAILVREPSLKPTAAMKRVIYAIRDRRGSDTTWLRRFQVKWLAVGASFLAQARRAAEYKPPATTPRDLLAAINGGYRMLEAMPVSPWLAGSLEKSSFEQRYKEATRSPQMEALAQRMAELDRHARNAVPAFLEDVKRMTEFQTVLDSPAMRDMAAKIAEADRQFKWLAGNYLSSVSKTI